MIDYHNIYDNGNKGMNFKCFDKELLKKNEEIWKTIISIKNKKFTKEPTYVDKYDNINIKSKIIE